MPDRPNHHSGHEMHAEFNALISPHMRRKGFVCELAHRPTLFCAKKVRQRFNIDTKEEKLNIDTNRTCSFSSETKDQSQLRAALFPALPVFDNCAHNTFTYVFKHVIAITIIVIVTDK